MFAAVHNSAHGLDQYVFSQPGHKWLQEGMTKEQLQKIQEFYRQRYGEQPLK